MAISWISLRLITMEDRFVAIIELQCHSNLTCRYVPHSMLKVACKQILVTALFTMASNRKQLKCPSKEEYLI